MTQKPQTPPRLKRQQFWWHMVSRASPVALSVWHAHADTCKLTPADVSTSMSVSVASLLVVKSKWCTCLMCQALLDWFLLLLATTGLVLGRGGLVLDWFRGAGGTTGLDTLWVKRNWFRCTIGLDTLCGKGPWSTAQQWLSSTNSTVEEAYVNNALPLLLSVLIRGGARCAHTKALVPLV